MGKTNNIIEINGQRYDATTGELLVASAPHQSVAKSKSTVVTVKVKVKPNKATSKRHRSAKSVTAHAPAHAQTLMRHAVKKPTAGSKHLKAQSHTESLAARPLAEVIVSRSAERVDSRRLGHAKHVPQNRLIRHFSDLGVTSPTPVAPVSRPITAKPAAQRAKPHTTADLLDRAVQAATSHRQPPPRHVAHYSRHGHKLTIAGGLVLAVLLIGVAGSQSLLDLRLHIASAKAGFDASLPTYKPTGFSLGQLNYSPGEVAADFHSNSNDGGYSLTRHRSDWDSQTLRNQFVAPADPSYQTVTSGGRTIYLYDSHNATWVSGGIWYVIQSNGSLSDRQLLDLATSL